MLTNNAQISWVIKTKNQNAEVTDFPEYSIIPNNSSANPGQSEGVLLALDVNIKLNVPNLEIEIQHSTWSICNVSRKSILVGGVYCRPNSIEELKRVLYEIRLAIKKGKKFGHVQFSSPWRLECKASKLGDKSNSDGGNFEQFPTTRRPQALNDGEPTFTCTNGKSVIALVICNANLHRHFCGLTMDCCNEMFTGAPKRGQYPVIATFDIAGNSRSTHVKDLKKPIGKSTVKP